MATALVRLAVAQGTALDAPALDAPEPAAARVEAAAATCTAVFGDAEGGWLGGGGSGLTLMARLAATQLAAPFPVDRRLSPAPQRRLLILSDMNGTLLRRTKRRIGRRNPDLHFNGLCYYLREHALAFCDGVNSGGHVCHVAFAFYTSMNDKSAQPAAALLRRGGGYELYGRDFNKADSTGAEAYDTMRDLDLLWRTPGRIAFGFDETNTVVIDDTARKMREFPNNVVVVPEYDDAAVARGNDQALLRLAEYVAVVAEAFQRSGDVRPYIRLHKFQTS